MTSKTFDSTMQSRPRSRRREFGRAPAPPSRAPAIHDLNVLPPALHKRLVQWVRRCRQLALLNAVGWAVSLTLIWMLMSCGADRLLALSSGWRWMLLFAGILFPALVLVLALLPLLKPTDWVAVAQSVERANPQFGQRLITVTSRLLGDQNYRGSEQMLAALIESVERDAGQPRWRRPSLRAIRAAWSGCLVAACAVLILLLTPGLDLGALVHRYVRPSAAIPPVTTTRLAVWPGDGDVVQSEPRRIDVRATRLGDAPVWLHLNNGATWSRFAMDALGRGRYSLTLTSTDHDIHYYVSAGDATSAQYLLKVRRVPAVGQFQIRYAYPAYAKRAPFTASNTTGLIEAIEGTEAQLTIYATEPLRSALIIIGGERVALDCAGPPNVWETRLKIEKSVDYQLDLLSARNMHGSGPERARITAVPDRPPIVRLEQGGQSLRLSAREMVPLRYQAIDDVGIDSLAVRAQVNGANSVSFPISVVGDPRHQEDSINFDLARLDLAIGDVLTLSLEARDGEGHAAQSDALQVLISPRSVDLETQRRIEQLNGAAQLAAMLSGEWEEARAAIDEADALPDHQSAAYAEANTRGDRHFTSAGEISALLRQSLLRAITHSASPEMSLLLAVCVDASQQQSIDAEDFFRRSGAVSGMGNVSRDRVQAALGEAKKLQENLQAVARGERAFAVLSDRENLKDLNSRPRPTGARAAERRVQSVQRINDEVAAGANEVGIDPQAPDLDLQLQRRRNVETALVGAAQPTDLVGAARQWAQELQGRDHHQTGLAARLSAAAQAEALRPDADLVRAHDLEQASRAAAFIEATVDTRRTGPELARNLQSFITAFESLQRAADFARLHQTAQNAQSRNVLADADRARGVIAELAHKAIAGAPATRPGALGQARAGVAEDLAMQAGADSIHHNYARVRELDQELINRLTEGARSAATRASAKPEDEVTDSTTVQQRIAERIERIRRVGQAIASSMGEAEAVDHLQQDQEQLENQAVSASGQAADLANVQRRVADAIAHLTRRQEIGTLEPSSSTQPSEEPDRRWQAAAAILTTQEELSAMPQALAGAMASAASRREADARVAMAQSEAANATPANKQAAERAAQQAQDDAREAARRLEKAIWPVSGDAAAAIGNRILPFVPETGSAGEILQKALLPALRLFEQAAWQNDVAGLEAAAADTRQVIEAAQRELAHAQAIVMQRDPLVAANWYARAAADSLSQADVKTALSHQSNVSLALSRVWDSSIHRAASGRLSILPSLRPVYGSTTPGDRNLATTQPSTPNFTAFRQWGKLRARDNDQLDAPSATPDPAGYEESLRLYFEAIEKAQVQPEKAK